MQIGINPRTYDSSVLDPWEELANRLSCVFSSEVGCFYVMKYDNTISIIHRKEDFFSYSPNGINYGLSLPCISYFLNLSCTNELHEFSFLSCAAIVVHYWLDNNFLSYLFFSFSLIACLCNIYVVVTYYQVPHVTLVISFSTYVVAILFFD